MVEVEKLDFTKAGELLRKGELVELSVVARKLNRSYNTVWQWVYEGKVDSVKIGGRIYVVRKSLNRFLGQAG